MSFHPEAKVYMALQQMDLSESPPSNNTTKRKLMHSRTPPFTKGSPLSHQTGSGLIASPRACCSSGLSRMVAMTWRMTELERRSWLAAKK
ncbi:hypothetical protein PHLCEN_2v7795 [Hermanssonia centrifuga]|uniref:Uncharacterized protein n=1 Tax=Hermanssonia centrifuga TaxID=98765 RepID=A0A2R6NVP1_9APHY|nr:hypothetical protein PHLCEN_2v7795 [Hermanssonia centrifuga]